MKKQSKEFLQGYYAGLQKAIAIAKKDARFWERARKVARGAHSSVYETSITAALDLAQDFAAEIERKRVG